MIPVDIPVQHPDTHVVISQQSNFIRGQFQVTELHKIKLPAKKKAKRSK